NDKGKEKSFFEGQILNRITSPLSIEDSDNINFKEFLDFYPNGKAVFPPLPKRLNLPAFPGLYFQTDW
ncbi:hypothetical protein, partial [Akkermansia sp.]